MGKGDRRTRKGKVWRGTYGNTRPKAGNRTGQSPAPAKGKKKSAGSK